jgi:hypothetical protein
MRTSVARRPNVAFVADSANALTLVGTDAIQLNTDRGVPAEGFVRRELRVPPQSSFGLIHTPTPPEQQH